MRGQSVDLSPLNLPFTLPPDKWKTIPRGFLPTLFPSGQLKDASGTLLGQLVPRKNLGEGTFSKVEEFTLDGQPIAIKRPKHGSYDFFLEALVQWHLHRQFRQFGISFCVPEVFQIFRWHPTGDVWFGMRSFQPVLLSQWCVRRLSAAQPEVFAMLMLQIAILLEVLEDEMQMDHRDLKVNNMLIVEDPVPMSLVWRDAPLTLTFPFHVVFLDFGFTCWRSVVDVREGDGLPPLDPCPKEGRDLFQVIASLWHIQVLRSVLGGVWGTWITSRLGEYAHTDHKSLDWMYMVTDDCGFRAPACKPRVVIEELLGWLAGHGKIALPPGGSGRSTPCLPQ